MKIKIDRGELLSIITLLTIQTADLTLESNKIENENLREKYDGIRDYYADIRKNLMDQYNGVGA